jgi:hypothetical protein
VFAARDGARRRIAAWGTLQLDGTRRPYRFATLDVLDDSSWEPQPGAADTGAYLVEQTPSTYWLIAFFGTTGGYRSGAQLGQDGEPVWQALDDTGIAHSQMHNHGKAYATIGLRSGRWVVLREEDYNSSIEPDTMVREFETVNGARERACPPLARHQFLGVTLMLWWPARSVAELTEPTRDALNLEDYTGFPGPEVDRVVARPSP